MVQVGDVVRILPEFYLSHAPMPYGVIERIEAANPLYRNFLVGFVMSERKLWMTPEDVQVVGHCDG